MRVPPRSRSASRCGADPEADDEVRTAVARPASGAARSRLVAQRCGAPLALIDRRQFLAGLLFGIACTARLTVVFGAPFFMLVGGGGSWARRSISAGLGAAIPRRRCCSPTTSPRPGTSLHPGYEYQYQLEANGYGPSATTPTGASRTSATCPRTSGSFLLSTPAILPGRLPSGFGASAIGTCAREADAARGLFDERCPLAIPRDDRDEHPARRARRSCSCCRRCPRGARASSPAPPWPWLAIAFVNLMHFSQGWVQFGYRFSNDFVVFALPARGPRHGRAAAASAGSASG